MTLFGREGTYQGNPTSILIVEHGRMPSTDYFVLPRAKSLGVPSRVVDSALLADPPAALFAAGTLVIFVRYVESAWGKAVLRAKNAGLLSGLIYFTDDDLFDIKSLHNLPTKYARKIRKIAPGRKWLIKHQIILWVASRYLQEKYRDHAPVLIAPCPEESLYSRRNGPKIFYHGTASHSDEINWLIPIIRQVQERCDHTTFEIIGDLSVNRLYRNIPRVSVLHPMSWDNYRAHCARADLQIGLAPLLETPFNAARSTTKFFDMVRCGAVGIYSDREPFSSFIRNRQDGFLVENSPALWADTIVSLAQDPDLRCRTYRNARQRALDISNGAG
jgi:hypothetical protein